MESCPREHEIAVAAHMGQLPEELATMIVSFYRMSPERVLWFVVTEYDSTAQCKQLKFKFDPRTGEYSQPRESRVNSIRRALGAYGIEL